MLSIDLEKTFALIREQRDKLNGADDELAEVLRHVEGALIELKPGIPAEVYIKPDAPDEDAYWLGFEKWRGRWIVSWAREDGDDPTPLAHVARERRSKLFAPTPDGPSPIEQLILGVAESVTENVKARQPLVDRARALSAALLALGFAVPPPPTSS